jgi:hypothetical protein
VEVLGDALVEIVEHQGLEARKAGRVQLREFFHFVHGVDLVSDPSVTPGSKKSQRAAVALR